ncbi:ATP-dependent endonuclease [Halobacillus halophilus]|uniref:ATP-dependent nuclease n=1 Tax=Halobacillus halophilus TaxID=1570 RepID=UPI0005A229EC|nr:ATP-dependent endonuclease [Halobacillus halophilus]
MKITSVTLKNYRSFGEIPQKVHLDNITALIGGNSTGKTALISSLVRLFGQKNSERTLIKSDFHIPHNISPDDIEEINLFIEVRIEFPELVAEDESKTDSVPPFFRQMIVDRPGGIPYMRIRLEGKWIQGLTPEGDIEQDIYYITVPEGQPEEEAQQPIPVHQRNAIQLIYVPAMRDPMTQLKNASGTILWRILRNIEWPDTINEEIKEKMGPVMELFSEIPDVKSVKETLNKEWNSYHKDPRYSHTDLMFSSTDLTSILKKVEVHFSPNEDGNSSTIDRMGDGLRSLFYLTLVSSLLEIEQNMESDVKPALNILAVEEPENHVSPHLLGRVVSNLSNISNKENSQVVISSHSASIIKKIDPEQIRHMQIENHNSIVKGITLPDKQSESFTYIKEAVKAYPDLYFSKLVVLGEGDSEEIVMPKLLSAYDIYPDETSISIVPLGGRHVNHLWKLLNQLSIPHITLLDLDRERYGGGWGRIKYALKQLIENGHDPERLLSVIRNGDPYTYTVEQLEEFHERSNEEVENMECWISILESKNVFFSNPLDLDFSMLKSFEQQYKSTMTYGPRIPDETTDEYTEKKESSIQATLKSEKAKGVTYTEEEKKLMIWYNSLFLGRGKPSTHIAALSNLGKDEYLEKAPSELKSLAERVNELLVENRGSI